MGEEIIPKEGIAVLRVTAEGDAGSGRPVIDIKEFGEVTDVRNTDTILLTDSLKEREAAQVTVGNFRRSLTGRISDGGENLVSAKDVKGELEKRMDCPANAGIPGQVLRKTENGSEWSDGGGGTGVYEPGVAGDLSTPEKIHGIAAGTPASALRGRSISSILDDLFFETIAPTLTSPSVTLSVSPSGRLYEIGTVLELKFTASFNRGSIKTGTVFQDYRSGTATEYSFSGTNQKGISAVCTHELTIAAGTKDFRVTVKYGEGPQPRNSKGEAYGKPLEAGSVTSGTVQIEGTYPIFATTTNIEIPGKVGLVSLTGVSAVEIDLATEGNGHKQLFLLPVVMKSLTGLQMLNTLSGKYENTDTATFTKTTVSREVNGVAVSYLQYVYNGSNRGSVKLKLLF